MKVQITPHKVGGHFRIKGTCYVSVSTDALPYCNECCSWPAVWRGKLSFMNLTDLIRQLEWLVPTVATRCGYLFVSGMDDVAPPLTETNCFCIPGAFCCDGPSNEHRWGGLLPRESQYYYWTNIKKVNEWKQERGLPLDPILTTLDDVKEAMRLRLESENKETAERAARAVERQTAKEKAEQQARANRLQNQMYIQTHIRQPISV